METDKLWKPYFVLSFFPFKSILVYIQKSRNIYWWYEEMSDLIKTWMPWKYRYISFYRNTFLTPINYPKVVLKSELAAYIYRMIYSFPYVNFKCQMNECWNVKCWFFYCKWNYHKLERRCGKFVRSWLDRNCFLTQVYNFLNL